MEISKITELDDKNHIALFDTTSISFMQGLSLKGLQPETILKDYDLILIPEWVLIEIEDCQFRIDYVHKLINQGYPIYCIEEGSYTDLANREEINLFEIVRASTNQLGNIKSYLRRYVKKDDPLDLEEYKEWIKKLYDEWPIPGEKLSNGRIRKKNAGEISITILAEIVSWYHLETMSLTIYSQDRDTYEFQRKAEEDLRHIFVTKTPVPVSYKSNDAILCQLIRDGKINLNRLDEYRKDIRAITYSKQQKDQSIILVTELIDNKLFAQLVLDKTVNIIF